MQEGEGGDWGSGVRQLGEGRGFDAVGRVDDGFGGVKIRGGGIGDAKEDGGVVVEAIACGGETADTEPGRQWRKRGGAPVGVGGKRWYVDNGGEVRPGADQLCGLSGCENGGGRGEFFEGGAVAVVGELVGYGDDVDVRVKG